MWRTVISDSEDELKDSKKRPNIREAVGDDDGTVFILNDPPSSRRPVARHPKSPSKQKGKKTVPIDGNSVTNGTPAKTRDPFPDQTPLRPQSNAVPGAQTRLPDFFTREGQPKKNRAGIREASTSTTTPTIPVTTTSKPKRKTKKALQQERQTHLAAYAQALFDELNESVFMNRLPKDTPLLWNNRLLATAGRAKWRKLV